MRQVERGILAADATVTRFESLSPVSRFADAVEALVRTTQHEFPVVDGAGRLLGVLTRDAMIRALTEHGPDVAVTEIMTRDIPVVQPRQSLEHAIQLLRETGSAVVGVVDAASQLVGLITPENIGGILMLHAAKPRRPTAGPRGQTVTSPQLPWPLSYRYGGRSPGSRQSRRVLLGPLDPKKRLDADHVARVRSRRSDRTRAARGCDAKEAVGRLHKMASTAGGDPSTLSITVGLARRRTP
jgi:CBS domain-containing protein